MQANEEELFLVPVEDCTSGPVQKMTQHLQKVHHMDRSQATAVSQKKRRAPAKAVNLFIKNPYKRSSGDGSLPLLIQKQANASPSTSRRESSSSTCPSEFHWGGEFLDGLLAHLQTHAGGNRSLSTSTAITKAVGKYLYSLNDGSVKPSMLLDTHPVQPYLQGLISSAQIGSCGMLHSCTKVHAAGGELS